MNFRKKAIIVSLCLFFGATNAYASPTGENPYQENSSSPCTNLPPGQYSNDGLYYITDDGRVLQVDENGCPILESQDPPDAPGLGQSPGNSPSGHQDYSQYSRKYGNPWLKSSSFVRSFGSARVGNMSSFSYVKQKRSVRTNTNGLNQVSKRYRTQKKAGYAKTSNKSRWSKPSSKIKMQKAFLFRSSN